MQFACADNVDPYLNKPARLLREFSVDLSNEVARAGYCAGFELQAWRCAPLADHLIEWIADYALKEDELNVSHVNMYVRLRQAAVRVYRSENYKKRGEIGEILLHGICRDFFETIPFAPRVFYLSSSNDVVKGFDLVHVRYKGDTEFELWLGEAKFYEDSVDAIKNALASVSAHIDQGFLNNEKLLLGPQISKSIPKYQEIRDLLSVQTSLDTLFETAVFPICIASDSVATAGSKAFDEAYAAAIEGELATLAQQIIDSGLQKKVRIVLIYVPLASKKALAEAFDARLKGFTM